MSNIHNKYPEDTAQPYAEYAKNGLRYRKVAEALVAAAQPLAGKCVLDLGCGTGLLTGILSKEVGPSGRVIGVDASEAMLETALDQDMGSNVKLIHSSAEEVDQRITDTVDTVLSNAAFWQFDREPTLQALSKVLIQNGLLIYSLSAGFFNFKASGLWQDSDERPIKQKDIMQAWVRLARERYPERDFPTEKNKPKAASLEEIQAYLAQAGFSLERALPIRFEIPLTDEYEWLKIPQWTDRSLAPLSLKERITLLDEVFEKLPKDTTLLSRWVVIVARKDE